MIFNYIERSINRKIYLVNLLYCTHNQTLETLAIRLNCSTLTVASDIEYLNETLDIPIVLNEQENTYSLTPEADASLQTYIKDIYQTSLFLQFLKYFMLTKKPSLRDFINEQHVSTAKGYRLRESVISFLHSINLDLKHNVVSGRVLWIRFLAAELTRSFGMEILEVTDTVEQCSNQILDEMQEHINITFSQQERELYTLLIASSLTTDIAHSYLELTASDCRIIGSQLYPKAYEQSVKKHLINLWNENNQEAELKFAIVAFAVVNSHLFDKSVPKEQAEIYQKSFLQLEEARSLIAAIEKKFKIHPRLASYFYTAIFTFLSDAIFRLQPIFTSPCYDDHQIYRTHIFKDICAIIEEWNVFGLDIEKYRIADLCSRLTPILIPDLYDKAVIITECTLDGNFLRDYLLTINPKYDITVQKNLTDWDMIYDNPKTLFVLDKALSRPFEINQKIDNVTFIFFPLNEHAMLELLTKLFK